MRKDDLRVHPSSGNVFADIGLPNPERVLARSQLMTQITEIIRGRGLTQQKAAAVLGISQPKVSCLMNGKLSMFSLEHLCELLNALDRNVEILIMPKMRKEKSATTKIYSDFPIGKLRRVKDFLPPPDKLVMPRPTKKRKGK